MDWMCVKQLVDMLKIFFDMTLRISGSQYVTSNTFFSEISDLHCMLLEWENATDLSVQKMGMNMRMKFDK